MAVLLLRLVAPMQSWGTQSYFIYRDTGLEPSKSGIIGLLCAALGRGRTEPVNDLAALRMGVRVDGEGRVMKDFQTAQKVLQADGESIKPTVTSWRYYLADARFLVGLEGEDVAFLRRLHEALRDPVWPLYLGRKAFVPGCPIWLEDGLHVGKSLEEVLTTAPWLAPAWGHWPPDRLRLVVEDFNGPEVRRDHPISFDIWQRRYLPRRLRTLMIDRPSTSRYCLPQPAPAQKAREEV